MARRKQKKMERGHAASNGSASNQVIKQALMCHQAGRLQEAEQGYRQVLATDINHPDANHLLGVLASQVGEVKDALVLIRRAIESNPHFPDAHNSLGNVHRTLGNTKEAMACYKQAITINPDLAPAHNNLGITHRESGNLEKAATCYRRALAIKPEDPATLSNLGNVLQDLGSLEEAIECYQKALAVNSNLGEIHYCLGGALLKVDRPEEAFPSLAKAADLLPNHSDAIASLGQACYKTKQFDKAILCYQKALDIEPKNQDYHNTLGIYLQQAEELEEAIVHLTQACTLDPNNLGIKNNLGNALQANGDLTEALKCYQEIITADTNNADAYNHLGTAHKNLGDLEEAKASFDTAISLNPELIEAHINLGNVCLATQLPGQAVEHYKQALSIDQTHAEGHFNLGNALREMGLPEEAEASYKQSIACNPQHIGAHVNLGTILQESGLYQEAAEFYRGAIAIKPNHEGAQNNLGNALMALGELEEAESCFMEALSINPGSLEAQFNLSNIRGTLGLDRTEESVRLIRLAIEKLPSAEIKGLKHGENTDIIESLDKIVALMPLGRSGSMFFHSLFDGHPEITTTPGVYMKGFFGKDVWNTLNPRTDHKTLVDNFCVNYEVLFDAQSKKGVFGNPLGKNSIVGEESGMTQMGENRDLSLAINEDDFKKHLSKLLGNYKEIDDKTFFKLAHLAYDMTLGRSRSSKTLFYHIHNPESYELARFLRSYPKTRFIQIVREPVQSLESWANLRYLSQEKIEKIESIKRGAGNHAALKGYSKLATTVSVFSYCIKHPAFQVAPAIGVRLEDVKCQPKQVMPAIAQWIGIEDHETLLAPSFQDLEYWGPASKINHNLRGFDTANINRSSTLFSEQDQHIFRTLFYPVSTHFGYQEKNEAVFQKTLAEIEPLLDEPFDFEKKIYNNLRGITEPLTNLGPYHKIHSLLKIQWEQLKKDSSYQGNVKCLEF